MDYKYIKQLLDRYWRCETTLEEENILRTFFSQSEIPAELKQFQPLFAYQAKEVKQDVLGEDFDRKVLSEIERPMTVKARIIPMGQRLKPLFKAAAVVAIVLTLGNALQVPFQRQSQDPISNYDGYYKPELDKGTSVAIGDSAQIDTMRQSMVMPESAVKDEAVVK